MTDRVNQYTMEALSALMDGELPSIEQEALVEELLQQPQVRAQWLRYHLAKSVLQDAHFPLGDKILLALDRLTDNTKQ